MTAAHITFGAAFLGLIVASVLYGITLLQTFLYFRSYPKDSKSIKAMVAIVWFLDTLHLILCIISAYWYLIINFSNEDAFRKPVWSMNIQTDCNGLIGLIVECFFARRVLILSGNRILTAIIVVLACVHFGLGIVFTVEEFLLADSAEFSKLIWVTSTGLGSAAAADVIIACSLCYYLLQNRTGFKRTDSLISTLIAYSLTTGLITSILAIINVVTFATLPSSYVWLAVFWILGKCYVNSLLAALSVAHFWLHLLSTNHVLHLNLRLNSRDSLRERASPPEGTFLHLSYISPITVEQQSVHQQTSRHDVSSKTSGTGALAVKVHTQTFSKSDPEPATPSTGKGCYMEELGYSHSITDNP